MTIGRALRCAASMAILFQASLPAAEAAKPHVVARPQAGNLIAQRLTGLPDMLEGLVAEQIAARDVAGAVVTVVYRGNVVFTRGYGFADLDRHIPVDPQRTLFRPGSSSKMFTWTALLQQVEKGRVDLDADVNTYLDFKIPPFGKRPIRVRDLLQHTPGMDDVAHITVDDESKLVPFRDWIKTHIPARLWEAGTEISYSNYGVALAGYIVERVSGEQFPDYVERHVFQPLGMTSTTFREPLPAALRDRMATGYVTKDGRLVAQPYEFYSNVMPAGSAATTAPDMARFAMMILGKGQLGNTRVLKPESVALLERDSITNAPGLNGVANGFWVTREAGPRIVGHGGDTGNFHSSLMIVPQEDFGFFVSETGGKGTPTARTELRNAIIGRVFPQAPAPRWTGNASKPTLGMYRSNRQDRTLPIKPDGDLKVSMPAPHRILIESGGQATAFDQIGPDTYEQVTGTWAGGPYEKIRLFGGADDPKLAFDGRPNAVFRLVKP